MIFMYGKYRFDKIGDGRIELKYRCANKIILTINLHIDKFTFLVVFGEK